MTITSTFKPALVQHGSGVDGGDAWTSYETDISAQSGQQEYVIEDDGYAQSYDFGLSFEAVRGLPLETPNFFSQASQSLSFTLALETDQTSIPTTWRLSYFNTERPATWSDSNSPFATATVIADLVTIEAAIPTASWSLNSNGSTYDISYAIDLNKVYNPPAHRGKRETINSLMKTSRWNGLLGIQIFLTSGTGSILVAAPTAFVSGFVSGQSVPFHTGWEGWPASKGRPVTDMRTGFPAVAQELVEDEFLPGIWTRPDQADPDDPRRIRQVEFPPNESTKEDDVPV